MAAGGDAMAPLPVESGTDGRVYSSLQAVGHVLGMTPQAVDETVTALQSAAAGAADKAKGIKPSLAKITCALAVLLLPDLACASGLCISVASTGTQRVLCASGMSHCRIVL